jgi:hypothetical protein
VTLDRFAGVQWDPLPEAGEPDGHEKTQFIVHSTGVSGQTARGNRSWFARPEVTAESTFVVGYGPDDPTLQIMWGSDRADANRSASVRAYSVEVCGAATEPYNDWQVGQLVMLGRQARDAGVPARIIPRHDEPGFGWHSMWRGAADALQWTSDAYKTCLPMDSTEVLTADGWLPIVQAADRMVASWSPESGAVTFARAVLVEPFMAEVVDIGGFESTRDHDWLVPADIDVTCSCGYRGTPRGVRNHAGHGTRRGEDHRVIRASGWKKIPAGDIGHWRQVPGSVDQNAPGLPLSDDQVRLIAWFQADGSIMREARSSPPSVVGVEWHFRKARKIDRVTAILSRLDITHSVRARTDGTTVIRVYGDEARDKIISLLPTKRFGWDLLQLSAHQAGVLWDEATLSDGDSTHQGQSNMAFSTDQQSIDVLQAIAVLNGRSCTVWDSGPLRWARIRRRGRGVSAPRGRRITSVACLTTVDGTLIIRQHGRVVVTGNCPGATRIDTLRSVIFPAIFEEDDMPTAQEIAAAVWGHPVHFLGNEQQPATLVMRDIATNARKAAAPTAAPTAEEIADAVAARADVIAQAVVDALPESADIDYLTLRAAARDGFLDVVRNAHVVESIEAPPTVAG